MHKLADWTLVDTVAHKWEIFCVIVVLHLYVRLFGCSCWCFQGNCLIAAPTFHVQCRFWNWKWWFSTLCNIILNHPVFNLFYVCCSIYYHIFDCMVLVFKVYTICTSVHGVMKLFVTRHIRGPFNVFLFISGVDISVYF